MKSVQVDVEEHDCFSSNQWRDGTGTKSFGGQERFGPPVGPMASPIERAVAYRELSEPKDRLAAEELYLEEDIPAEMGFDQIIGNGTALRHLLELVNTVAATDSTVLLLGETGTGKELIARAIHEHSRRRAELY